MAENYTIANCSCKHDQDSYKRQPIACQLHSDWLQTIGFLVVHPIVITMIKK
jgi:hypothetical protein